MSPRWIAIVLLFSAGTAAGADLGRMFFTPAQRATLDDARKQSIRGVVVSENPQAAPMPQNVSVNGVVRRSDGKSTVWLNNRPVSEKRADGISASAVKNDNRVKLTVPESGRSVDLKVGQTVEILSGTIEESYARRKVPKPDAKAAPGTENTASGVEKTAPLATAQPAKPEASAPKRPLRSRQRDAQDDFRPDGAPEAK